MISNYSNKFVGSKKRGLDTMSGGTISGNTASTAGSGVYVSAGATFEYAGSGIASGQVVYLNNTSGNSDAYISITDTVSNSIIVECAYPAVNTVVASKSSSVFNNNEKGLFAYNGGSHTFTRDNGNYDIVINS